MQSVSFGWPNLNIHIMLVTGSIKSVIKPGTSLFGAILGVLIGITVTSMSSGAFAQDEKIISYFVQEASGYQGIQERKITGENPCFNLKPETEPADLAFQFSRPPRPARSTLLPSEIQSCFAPDLGVNEISNRFAISLAGSSSEHKFPLSEPEVQKSIFPEGSHKSYLIPALEIIGFNLALNVAARIAYPNETQDGKKVYQTNLSTFWDNLVHGPWLIDQDSYTIAQLRHPYQGAIYQGFARSAGLSFWESAGYTFLGEFLWNTAGETDPPAINDQISSGIAGVFLGEPLFRMASLVLEHGEYSFWRELAAALISPPAGFNRHVFGDQFRAVFPSYDPAIFWRAQVGATWNFHTSGANSSDFKQNDPIADFSITYGLPGKPGYHYTRPFDYFEFEVTTNSSAAYLVENLLSRGLLFGTEYELGNSYRGIWGLYGSYDYTYPNAFFRASSTAFSLGTTSQWWLSHLVALQSTVLAGLGYAGGGEASPVGHRDFHYGLTLQDLISLRLIIGDLAMLEATHRGYYISDVWSPAPKGNEIISNLNLGLTVRIHGPHALEVQCLFASRDGNYDGMPDQHQRVARVALLYNLLSDTHFGAVEWRESR